MPSRRSAGAPRPEAGLRRCRWQRVQSPPQPKGGGARCYGAALAICAGGTGASFGAAGLAAAALGCAGTAAGERDVGRPAVFLPPGLAARFARRALRFGAAAARSVAFAPSLAARRASRYCLLILIETSLWSPHTLPNTGAAGILQPGTGQSCRG